MDEIWQSLRCYWVEPGKLLAGALPGRSTLIPLSQQLLLLHQLGVRQIIDLTQPGENNDGYNAESLKRWNDSSRQELHYEQHSIMDMGIPSYSTMKDILMRIDECNQAGDAVYVHCFGGLGRTGTVVGCYLVQKGLSAEAALERIPRLRSAAGLYNFPSPEVAEQVEYIYNWPKS